MTAFSALALLHMMRKTLVLACCVVVGVLALAGGRPAQATPAVPAIYNGETSAGVINVGPRYRYAPRQYYYRYYGYRPYYYRPSHRPLGPTYRYAPRQYSYRHYGYRPYYHRPYHRPF